MLNRTLSAIALFALVGATIAAPTASADRLCMTVNDTLHFAPDSGTPEEVRAFLENMGCPEAAIQEVLCMMFGGLYCYWLVDDVLELGTDIENLVKPIHEQDHIIKAAGVTVVASSKGVQYKDGCGTNLERQFNCRGTAPSLPSLPSMPAPPVSPITVYSPVTLSVAVGDIVIVWPSQITVAPCVFWPGDLNCS